MSRSKTCRAEKDARIDHARQVLESLGCSANQRAYDSGAVLLDNCQI